MKSLKNSNNINFNSLNNNFKATEKKSTFNIRNKSYKEKKKYILNTFILYDFNKLKKLNIYKIKIYIRNNVKIFLQV